MSFYTKRAEHVKVVHLAKGACPGSQVLRYPAWCFREAVSCCSLAEARQVLQVGRWVGRSNREGHSKPHSHHSCLFFGCMLALVSTARGFPSPL